MSDRDLVRALAEHDRGRAPSYAAMRRGAATRRPTPVPAVAAVAAGVLLALAVVGRRGHDDSLGAAIVRAQELSAWSAPTAAFLDPLEDTITGSTPTLTLSSVTLPETRSNP